MSGNPYEEENEDEDLEPDEWFGQAFRASPSIIHVIENNLSIFNADFADFFGGEGEVLRSFD